MRQRIPALVFVGNGKSRRQGRCRHRPLVPATRLLRLIALEKLNLLSRSWEAKWFWCLKRLIALKKKWIRCSPGPDPSNGRANRKPFVRLLFLRAAVSPSASRLSPFFFFCGLRTVSCRSRLGRRRDEERLRRSRVKKREAGGRSAQLILSGLCSRPLLKWLAYGNEGMSAWDVSVCLSGWRCWQGGII